MTKIRHEAFLSTADVKSSHQDIDQAVREYQAVLKEQDQASDPLGWARATSNLAIAMHLGNEEVNPHDNANDYQEQADKAIVKLRSVLAVLDTDDYRPYWVQTQYHLGLMSGRLSQILINSRFHRSLPRFNEAESAYIAALSVWTKDEMPVFWVHLSHTLARLYKIKFYSFRFEDDREKGLKFFKQLIEWDEERCGEQYAEPFLMSKKRAYDTLKGLSKISQKKLKRMYKNDELIYE